ncbi:MAG TPA: o-succinylbenzoate synthase [Gemmatimonadota bacterium]|nr:o-succinylbenzoate synthase [Gemmatimonadota bacterium]
MRAGSYADRHTLSGRRPRGVKPDAGIVYCSVYNTRRPRAGRSEDEEATIRIETIELREIRLALREPFRISSGTVSERRILLVRLADADGAEAWSECVAGERPNYSPETIDTAWLALESWIAPRLLGVALRHPSQVAPLLDEDLRGHRMAKAAAEMGAWGLAAVREGVSLSELLGGERSRVETGISIGLQASPDALAAKAREAAEAGYRKIKMKIEPGADVEYVRAVREALGPDAALAVDANAAYAPGDEETLGRLDELGLIMIEQPFEGGDLVRHAALQARLRTPLCLDESITSPARAEDMVSLDAGRIVNIKPGRVGGYAASMAIHDLCRERSIPVWCGGMLESGIGRAYNVALASLPGFTLPGDISPSARYWAEDIVDPEWTMDRGWVDVPRGEPGLGVSVDADAIEDRTVRARRLG